MRRNNTLCRIIMKSMLQSPSFLPSCILAGVALIFFVLVSALPPEQGFGLIFGSAVAVGLVLARLRRQVAEGSEPVSRLSVRS